MWGIFAAIMFLIALIINLAVKGANVKYALDFAYAGGIFLGAALATAYWGSWRPAPRQPGA